MEFDETEIRNLLLEDNEQFQRLAEQHRRFEDELEELNGKRPFTDQDHYQELVLKKQKLLLKDRMAAMVESFREQRETATQS